jgi:hypothetical protein
MTDHLTTDRPACEWDLTDYSISITLDPTPCLAPATTSIPWGEDRIHCCADCAPKVERYIADEMFADADARTMRHAH